MILLRKPQLLSENLWPSPGYVPKGLSTSPASILCPKGTWRALPSCSAQALTHSGRGDTTERPLTISWNTSPWQFRSKGDAQQSTAVKAGNPRQAEPWFHLGIHHSTWLFTGSFRLERTLKIIKSDHELPSTATSTTNSVPQVPHLHKQLQVPPWLLTNPKLPEILQGLSFLLVPCP